MIQPGRKRRTLIPNLILALVSIAITLGMAELAARLLWQDPPPPRAAAQPVEWEGLPELPGPVELSYPNARGIHIGAYYQGNSDGFRGREYGREKPPGVFRIVLLGDSFAMGAGVLAEDTYAARLERALNERRKDRRYEVLNLGISGLDANAVVERMKLIGLLYNPDMIVYGFTLNDIEGKYYKPFVEKEQLGYIEAVQNAGRSRLYLARILGPRWASLRDLIDPPRDSYISELRFNYFENPEAWDDLTQHLDELAAIGKKLDVCAALFIHTEIFYLHWFHPFQPLYQAVAQAALRRGFYVKQSFPAFEGRSAAALWLNHYDSHPNEEGHAILAGSLLGGLDALPDKCWMSRSSMGNIGKEG
ncbi:MAG: SGNH/GDSL hydrolase family protein [Deltaproteobacteria bacterium]|nr:SGNH/GDSL hydrolase family protein [Deltaproteobacteria bacterium]